MIGIVIVAHGGLAQELMKTVEHVVGTQSNIRAICIDPDYDKDRKQEEILRAADEVDDGSGVVLATDMFGGSPSNLCLAACSSANRRVVYGTNLPLLIKLTKSRHLPVHDAVAAALMAGRKYLDAMSVCSSSDPSPQLRVASS